MVQRLLQVNLILINWFDFSISLTCQVEVVPRFSKGCSKHALNSIHKSCKLHSNLFKCDGVGKCHKNTYYPLDEHALYKDNFATRNGKL